MKTIAVKEDILISEDAINSIQTMYHSDIRSMINFLQLNQNLQMKEWEKNVINNTLLETVYKKIKSECSVGEFIRYIHAISIQYNVDKKHIIQSFFNHLIRTHSSDVTESLLDVIANITHTVDINLDDLLTYFYVSLSNKI
jgi:DNA polymerase III delta prime subunit